MPEPDSADLFPQVWTWKKPGFTNICSDFLADDTLLAAEDKTNVNLKNWPGYFEAGSAPSHAPLFHSVPPLQLSRGELF